MKLKSIKEKQDFNPTDWLGRKGSYFGLGAYGVWFWEDARCVSDETVKRETGIDMAKLPDILREDGVKWDDL